MDWLSLSDVEARVNALESLMVEKGLAEHEAVDAWWRRSRTIWARSTGGPGWWPGPGPTRRTGNGCSTMPPRRSRIWLHRLADRTHGGGGEHRGAAQCRRVHAVLVLPVDPAGHPAGVVQVSAVPGPGGERAAQRARRIRGGDPAGRVAIDVWDSSAEIRYLVIPQRPAGTEDLTVDELIPLISRDSMVGGTALVTAAGAA